MSDHDDPDRDRYHHFHPMPRTKAYKQGKEQGKLNLERYHYLRAAVLGKYTLVGPPYSGRRNIEFSSYPDFSLEPLTDVKLHPREDGTILPEDVDNYHKTLQANYKISEGGILDAALRDPRAFFNIMLNYHSRANTTGNPEWDSYFAKLKEDAFPKKDIQCMFFAREAGCLDGVCPFLHDEAAAREAREKVFEDRREYMLKPTPRQFAADRMRRRNAYVQAHNLDKFDELPDELEDEVAKIRASAFCANPDCGKPWLLTDDASPLKACSRCKWTRYCSIECQTKDWPRHKKEPCAPLEKIVKNDDLWSPIGTRKGTETFNVDWGDA